MKDKLIKIKDCKAFSPTNITTLCFIYNNCIHIKKIYSTTNF